MKGWTCRYCVLRGNTAVLGVYGARRGRDWGRECLMLRREFVVDWVRGGRRGIRLEDSRS